MNYQQRVYLCNELNKIPWIFLTKYPDDQNLKNIMLHLELEKKIFWDNWNNKWVTQ